MVSLNRHHFESSTFSGQRTLCSHLITSFGAKWEGIKFMGEKEAAAILVQTLFQSNDDLRRLIDENRSILVSPEEAAKFIVPYYKAMLLAVNS
jgi:hypothetical protein